LPVWSERLGLSGKCDIVEVIPTAPSRGGGRDATQAAFNPQHALLPEANQRRLTLAATIRKDGTLRPVEFKLGRRRQWENDDAQLCAQALCLEEMFSGVVPRGAVFHADSKRRREVEFTPALRETTEQAVAALHALVGRPVGDRIPPAVFKPACEACSLYDICLPRVTSQTPRLQRAARALFEI
jgi:CRISPR-associated exonuclease Cas4